MKKDLVSIGDLTTQEIFELLDLTKKLKKKPLSHRQALAYKTLALIFQKPSNRTRISFEVAMTHLGGYTLYLSPSEISMGVREPVKDVAQVISRYVNCIVARVFSHNDVLELAYHSGVPVINGLSDLSHPCQALSDIFTIQEKFGGLKGVKLAYIGDGNNVLNSLIMAAAKTGIDLSISGPRGYEPQKDIFEKGQLVAKTNGCEITFDKDPHRAVKDCDVIYTDVWTSMGQEEEKEKRLKDFKNYQVNEELVKSTGKDTYIMHCLPAHRGEEITDVIDGKNSIVYDQAENRMHIEKAVLLKLMSGRV